MIILLKYFKTFQGMNEGSRRKVVCPDDLLKYYKVWDNKISKVFKKIAKVDQPLKPILTLDVWNKILAIIEGKEKMESILKN